MPTERTGGTAVVRDRKTDCCELLAVGIFGSHSRLGDRIETLLSSGRAFSARPSAARISAGTLILFALTIGSSLTPRWMIFAQPASFDAASIKPNNSVGGRITFGPPAGGRFTATNVTPRMLIELAYKLKLADEPAWINSRHFDVVAKAKDGNLTDDQFRLMLQTLLEERFSLKLYHEAREVSVYAPVHANRSLKLPAAEAEKCAALRQGESPATTRSADVCGLEFTPNRLDVHEISMPRFAGALSAIVGKPVMDETGYTEKFSAHLEFEQESAGGVSVTADAVRPSIFTAIRDQLGLKLESRKGQNQVLVIDHVESPTEN